MFPRAGPDLLDKENLLLAVYEPRVFHVVTQVTIPENDNAVFIEERYWNIRYVHFFFSATDLLAFSLVYSFEVLQGSRRMFPFAICLHCL